MEEEDSEVKQDLLEQHQHNLQEIIIEASQVQGKGKRISVPEFLRLPSFSQVDADGNGKIDFQELKTWLPEHIPEEVAQRIFDEADVDHDGGIDRAEFSSWRTEAVDFARSLILPRNVVLDQKGQAHLHKELYSCTPPPIFMFVITLVEIGVFLYHWRVLGGEGKVLYNYGPPPLDSSLIYNPERRWQIWRYFTYVLVHSGYMHIINNVTIQLVLGVLLEMVHKWWRVLVIYFAGVLAGSLATSVVDPETYLAGASAGVYALIFAHMSTVILNWSEMEHPGARVLIFSIFISYDVGIAFYYAYYLGRETNVGYSAHIGGSIAGLLVGIYVLKNVKWERWENYLWYCSVVLASALVVFSVGWNCFKADYYRPNKY